VAPPNESSLETAAQQEQASPLTHQDAYNMLLKAWTSCYPALEFPNNLLFSKKKTKDTVSNDDDGEQLGHMQTNRYCINSYTLSPNGHVVHGLPGNYCIESSDDMGWYKNERVVLVNAMQKLLLVNC
jgi:hypothetical protein